MNPHARRREGLASANAGAVVWLVGVLQYQVFLLLLELGWARRREGKAVRPGGVPTASGEGEEPPGGEAAE